MRLMTDAERKNLDHAEILDAATRIANPLVLRDVCSKMVQGVGPVMCREWVPWPENPAVGDMIWILDPRAAVGSDEMTAVVWDGRRWV